MRRVVFAMLIATLVLPKMSVADFDTNACEKALLSEADKMDCPLSFSANAQERENVIKTTYGFVRPLNLNCTTQLNLIKSDIIYQGYRAIKGDSPSEIHFPSHKIDCKLKTEGADVQVSITLTFWIGFNKNKPLEAAWNITEVTGLPSFLGNLLIKCGNKLKLLIKYRNNRLKLQWKVKK